jgi:hypothetical protein
MSSFYIKSLLGCYLMIYKIKKLNNKSLDLISSIIQFQIIILM